MLKIKIVITTRGGEMAILNGHLYNKYSYKRSITRWRFQNRKCLAAIFTNAENYIESQFENTHDMI